MSRDAPIRFWRGANAPRQYWEFINADGTPADLTGFAFTLVVAWGVSGIGGPGGAQPAGSIRHTSDTAAREDETGTPVPGDSVLTVDIALGRVTWPYTIAETREIPRTAKATYELFRTIGAETTVWCGGTVTIESHLP